MIDSIRRRDCWMAIQITDAAIAENPLLVEVDRCEYRFSSELRPNQTYYCRRCFSDDYNQCPNLPDEIRDGRSLGRGESLEIEALRMSRDQYEY